MPTSSVQVAERRVDDIVIADITGSLVAGPSIAGFRSAVERLLVPENSKVLLNMMRVQYVDSTGIGALLGAKTSALHRHIELKVCAVPVLLSRLLGQLRLLQVLDVYDHEPEALAAFSV